VNPWHTLPSLLPAYEHMLTCHAPRFGRNGCACACCLLLLCSRIAGVIRHCATILHTHTLAGVQDLIGELVKTKEMNMNVSFTVHTRGCPVGTGAACYMRL